MTKRKNDELSGDMKGWASAVALLLFLGAGLGACCAAQPSEGVNPDGVTPEASASADAGQAEGPAANGPAAKGPPKLVVAIVIDQLGAWVLERYLPHLDPEGFFRRGAERGRWYRRVAYPYASTFTAPGHATLFTGKPPSETGIVANSYYDPEEEDDRPAVHDAAHPTLGRDERRVSPKNLRVPTVGDALHAQKPGAKIYTLSLKDRAAILPGGKKADLAVWYDHHIPGFTTSTYYAKALPPWLDGWLKAHPLANLLTPWKPRDPAMLRRLAGDDDAEGEADYLGLGATFPHDPTKALKPWSVLRLFPQMSGYTVELAKVIVEGAGLGEDDTVDLLSVSISGLDYTGHSYGPGSWEYLDHLVRLDTYLADFVDWLEKKHGPVAFLMTADHGVTPNPNKNPEGGGRLYPSEVTALAKAAAEDALGDPDLVSRYARPFVYLSPQVTEAQRAKLVAAVADKLTAEDGIRLAVDVREARTWRDDPDPLTRAIGLSITDDGPGDLYVVPEEHWVVDEHRPKGAGATHGAPWKSDREVPVILWGPGIEPAVVEEELSVLRVAPTLSALLGVAPPDGLTEAPLPGVSAATR
jgi:predicted AlkP superfamily pyrophosphatase or phosphodiesterase